MPTNSLAKLVNTGSLGSLAAESRRLQDLADSVRQRLPAKETEHLVAASTDEEGPPVCACCAPFLRICPESGVARRSRGAIVTSRSATPKPDTGGGLKKAAHARTGI